MPPVQPPSQRTYKTAARRQKSTFIHGVLTVCTVGLWSPIWLMACAENARIRRAQAEVAQYQASQRQGYYPPNRLSSDDTTRRCTSGRTCW